MYVLIPTVLVLSVALALDGCTDEIQNRCQTRHDTRFTALGEVISPGVIESRTISWI